MSPGHISRKSKSLASQTPRLGSRGHCRVQPKLLNSGSESKLSLSSNAPRVGVTRCWSQAPRETLSLGTSSLRAIATSLPGRRIHFQKWTRLPPLLQEAPLGPPLPGPRGQPGAARLPRFHPSFSRPEASGQRAGAGAQRSIDRSTRGAATKGAGLLGTLVRLEGASPGQCRVRTRPRGSHTPLHLLGAHQPGELDPQPPQAETSVGPDLQVRLPPVPPGGGGHLPHSASP